MGLKSLALKSALLGCLLMTGAVELPAQAMNDEIAYDCSSATEIAFGPAYVDLLISTGTEDKVQTLYFAHDSADLSSAARAVIFELAAELNGFEDVSIEVLAPQGEQHPMTYLRAQTVADEFTQVGFGITIVDDALARRAGINGVVIQSVMSNSPAEGAGLIGLQQNRGGTYPGDVIIRVGDTEVRSYDDIYTALDGRSPGERVSLTVLRDNLSRTVEVELYELPRE